MSNHQHPFPQHLYAHTNGSNNSNVKINSFPAQQQQDLSHNELYSSEDLFSANANNTVTAVNARAVDSQQQHQHQQYNDMAKQRQFKQLEISVPRPEGLVAISPSTPLSLGNITIKSSNRKDTKLQQKAQQNGTPVAAQTAAEDDDEKTNIAEANEEIAVSQKEIGDLYSDSSLSRQPDVAEAQLAERELVSHASKLLDDDAFIETYDEFFKQADINFQSVARDDSRLEVPPVLVQRYSAPKLQYFNNNSRFKRKRTELYVENASENDHHLMPEVFDDDESDDDEVYPPFGSEFPIMMEDTLFSSIDEERLRKRRRIQIERQTLYEDIFKAYPESSIEIGGKSLPLPEQFEPEQFAEVFQQVMRTSFQFNPRCSKEDFLSLMKEENKMLTSATEHLKAEKVKEKEQEFKKKWARAMGEIPKQIKVLREKHQAQARTMKKAAKLCQNEQINRIKKSVKLAKEATIKAKKISKEMVTFWRKYEKELSEKRKKRQKEEQERKKREEEQQEARRQQRKLNFLLTQTELYSHFMAKKSGGVSATEKQSEDNENDGFSAVDAMKKAQQAAEAQQQINQAFDSETAKYRHQGQARSSLNDTSLQDPSSMLSLQVSAPKMFRGSLKNYQLKGLNWLVSLYDQGINGILADEMGLGKTIQGISFLAHLAEEKGIWGPFLIIAPTSTLHNWQQEIEKFCPELKVLSYWGSVKERKAVRKLWNPAKLYNKDSPFHVCITSYGLILEDEKMFHKLKWQYMILDEAHQIKSAKSSRWKTLLNFKCRNRMLLTGTPIQNNMAELWALLHFIMPSLFDSHQEFDEWFSKDIESHAEQKGALNPQQLSRLHMILKPFMLRRVKKDVESEMAPKIEKVVTCNLSQKQKEMYKALKEQFSKNPKMATLITADQSKKTLMNFVMQFRKVCSHPELFGAQEVTSPFNFQVPMPYSKILPVEILKYIPEVYTSYKNEIEFVIPKVMYRDGLYGVGPEVSTELLGSLDAHSRQHLLYNTLSIFNPAHIHHSVFPPASRSKEQISTVSCFSFTRFVDLTPGDISTLYKASMIERFLVHVNRRSRMEQLNFYNGESHEDYPKAAIFNSARFLIQEMRNTSSTHVGSLTLDSQSRQVWNELVVADPADRCASNRSLIQSVNADCQVRAVAPTISFYCSDNSFYRQQVEVMQNHWIKYVLFHNVPTKARFVKDKTRYSFNVVHRPRANNMVVPFANVNSSSDFERPGLMSMFTNTYCANQIHMPSVSTMVASSGKLQILDQLLKKLKAEGHRVLIFSQMTKMLDILEDYMHARNYSFFRLDGQTNVQDRRDMVHTFQTDRKVFAFLLSTRAGGLGINLTSADTVIFYESDWNPTLDAQAMDRVHRIGQTKQVTVYRLVVGGTVEERILKIAQQKNTIQDTVYSGHFKADASEEPSSKDVMSVLLDDLEWDQMQKEKLEKEQAKKSVSKGKKKSTKKKKPADEEDGGEEKPKKKAPAKKRKREGDSDKPEGKKKKKTTKKNE